MVVDLDTLLASYWTGKRSKMERKGSMVRGRSRMSEYLQLVRP